jgi:hypothetical protein
MDPFNKKRVVALENEVKQVRQQLSDNSKKELSAVLYGSVWDVESWLDKIDEDLYVEGPMDAYRKVALVAQCINGTSHYATRKGFRTSITQDDDKGKGALDYINAINRQVNMDNVIAIAIVKREIYGRAAFEIVRDEQGQIVALLPLRSSLIRPHIDPETQMADYFEYSEAKDGKLQLKDVLYFSRLSLHRDMRGQSAITPIMNVIKLKLELYKDLLESAKRLWAPMGLFQMDTTDLRDPLKKEARMREFANQLKPGRSIIYNTAVEGKVVDLKPDIMGLVRAIEKADEEIMGNWQMPKAIFAREKSITKATLSAALNALYEGPIESVQRYFKRELERQWYDMIVREYLKLDPLVYSVKHLWNPVVILDSTLIRSLAYAVRVGAMTKEEFFHTMGWEILTPTTAMPPVQDISTPDDFENLIAEVQDVRDALSEPKEFPEEE